MAAEKKLEQLMNNAPESMESAQTSQSAGALAQAEAQGVPQGYNDTYSGKLDKAIDSWLESQGLGEYTPNRDKAYQQYAEQYQKNLAEGRKLADKTAVSLAGGWNPQNINAVSSEVYNDQMNNVTAAIPQFEKLTANERIAQQNQKANIVNLYSNLDNTAYSRGRDSVADYKNYLAALADRYANDRQADVQNNANMADVYNTLLNNAQAQTEEERNAENNRYLYNTQSADSKAQITANEYENSQKIAYNKEKDKYDEYLSNLSEKAKAEKEIQDEQQEIRGNRFIKAYNLKGAKYNYQLNQVAIGYYKGYIDLDEMRYIAKKLELDYDDIAEYLDKVEDQNKNIEKRYGKGYN